MSIKILLHNIPYVKVAGWRCLEALSAPLWLSRKGLQSDMAGKKEQSGMTEKKEQSGMTRNRCNVILSPLWASGSVVRRVMMRIVKFSCGSKDSDGAFALSAQPLRMTENVKNNGLVKVVICNGGVIC